jgi:transcriptional regulator GlxA family with amidase domain
MNKETEEPNRVANGGNGGQRRNSRLQRIQNWPELAEQANWSASALAKMCGVSTRALQRHFRENVGKPPKAWLSEQRHNRAAERLREGSSSVKEIAMDLGYQHGHNFSRQFRKHWGYAPSAKPGIRSADVKRRVWI